MDSPRPDPARQQLEAWLRYFDDLGLRFFYRDRENPSGTRTGMPVTVSVNVAPSIEDSAETAESEAPMKPPSLALHENPLKPLTARVAAESRPAGLQPVLQGLVHPPSLFEASERVVGDTLEHISSDLGECTRCKLHRQRHKIVFGAGNPRAELVFVGEGPGHDEDMQGLPFVGRAGKLLTQMIEAMGLSREDVYIANIVKCRPPENRQPQEDEVATCMPFLMRQLDAIQPKVVVCLGSTAAQSLLGTKKSISAFRGQWFDFRGAKLISTYHPAYLLRNPNAKPDVWVDLKKAMAVLGLAPPKPRRDAPRART
jgi:DNA polymerase